MKRLVGILAAVTLLLVTAVPVLAASLGISPSHAEIEVPGDGTAVARFKVHYFSGDLQISLVDIPLSVSPYEIHVDPSGGPTEIEVVIYGDESLGSQVYDGYIRFLGVSGETVAVAVQVKARVANIVEGQPLPAEPDSEEPARDNSPIAEDAGLPGQVAATAEDSTGAQSPFRVLPVAGIAAGTAIVITLIVVWSRSRYG